MFWDGAWVLEKQDGDDLGGNGIGPAVSEASRKIRIAVL